MDSGGFSYGFWLGFEVGKGGKGLGQNGLILKGREED